MPDTYQTRVLNSSFIQPLCDCLIKENGCDDMKVLRKDCNGVLGMSDFEVVGKGSWQPKVKWKNILH